MHRQDTKSRRVYVWDPMVRLFHWSLVLLIVFSWITAEVGGLWMQYHMWSGYTILTLLLFRILWGVLGSRYARFTSFLHGPRRIIEDIRSLPRPEPGNRTIGHTPLGGISIVLMLLALLTQAGTGLFSNDDIFTEGPLAGLVSKDTSDYLTWLHHSNFNLVLTLIAIHIGAALYYLLRKRQNLILPMITGYKKTAERDAPAAEFRPLRAVVILGIAALAVWLLAGN